MMHRRKEEFSPGPDVVQADWKPAGTVAEFRLRFDTRKYAEPETWEYVFDDAMRALGSLREPSPRPRHSLPILPFLGACGLVSFGRAGPERTEAGEAVLAGWSVL